MGVKISSRMPGSRASQPWMTESVFSIVSPAVTSRISPSIVKRKRVPDTSYALSFVVTDKYYITVNPADITVYMGGERGSDGVVDDGHIVGSNSLPEPGFVFELPKGITDISKIIFQTTDPADSKTWTIKPYDGNSEHEVYKIVPAEGQDPLRVEFTDPEIGRASCRERV